ncbi:MAG: hypothetical protein RLZZ143_2541 [Cyanobacteriota bacterium]|jgi:hypothetical protein
MIEVIGITTLLGYLRESIAKMKDPRKPSPNKQPTFRTLNCHISCPPPET